MSVHGDRNRSLRTSHTSLTSEDELDEDAPWKSDEDGAEGNEEPMPLAQETRITEDPDELEEELDELEGDDELAGMSPEQLADIFEKEVSSTSLTAYNSSRTRHRSLFG